MGAAVGLAVGAAAGLAVGAEIERSFLGVYFVCDGGGGGVVSLR